MDRMMTEYAARKLDGSNSNFQTPRISRKVAKKMINVLGHVGDIIVAVLVVVFLLVTLYTLLMA